VNHPRAVLVPALLAALAVLSGGCGLLVEGGAYAVWLYWSRDEEADAAEAELPSAYSGQVLTAGSRRAAVDVQYFVKNPAGGNVDIVAEYSSDGGGAWSPASDGGAPGDGVADLAAPASGQSHTFRWNLPADLPAASHWNEDVLLRITPADRASGRAGQAWVSLPLTVNVNSVPLCAGITPSGQFPDEVPVTYILLDAEGDATDVAVEFAPSGTGPWTAASRMASEGEGISGLAAAASGVVHAFVWDCRADLSGQANVNGVFLRISPADSAVPSFAGTPWVSDAVDDVNYNTAPSILGSVLTTVFSPVTTVAVSYILTDAESDPADIVVEYQKNGTGPWTVAAEGTPGSEGVSNLATAVSPGTSHVFVWDFHTETTANLTVSVRISVADHVYGNSIFPVPPAPWTSNSFQINAAATAHTSIVSIQTPAGMQTDAVAVPYTLLDNYNSTGHAQNVEVRYSTDGGSTWVPASGSASEAVWDPSSQGTTSLTADPDGEAHVFVWDSFRDLGGQDRAGPPAGPGVRIRVMSLEYGNFATTAAFALMNSRVATVLGSAGTTLNNPTSVAFDASGNVYICDTYGNAVRVLNAQSSGQVFAGVSVAAYSLGVIAGTGASGYNGDNIPAISANLNFPRDVALDASTPPNVFVADTLNHRIRRIDGSTGFITTAAGTGVAGRASDGGLATQVELNAPADLVFSSGNLWIADTGNHQIRFFNRGSAAATVFGVAVNPGSLRRISGQANGTSGFAGDGQAFAAGAVKYNSPHGVEVDAAGNLFLADTGNYRLRAANATGATITVAGTTVAAGKLETVAGSNAAGFAGDGGVPTAARLQNPRKLALDGSGDIFFADTGNSRIRAIAVGASPLVVGAVTVAAGRIDTIAGGGTDPADHRAALGARLFGPEGIALDGLSPRNPYVADTGSNRIRIVNARSGPPALAGVATDQGATVSVSAGQVATVSGAPPSGLNLLDPRGMALRGTNLFIADPALHQVLKLDLLTRTLSVAAGTGQSGYGGDGGAAASATLNAPAAVSLDSAGSLLLIADSGNNAVRVVNLGGSAATAYGKTVPAGAVDTVSTSSTAPVGVFVDAAGGADDAFVADTGGHRVRRILRSGGAETVIAGTGTQGFAGDGGAATAADFDSPSGVCVLPAGAVVVADTGNHRVRSFAVGGNVSTVAGTGAAGFNGDGLLAVNAWLNGPVGLVPEAGGTFLVFDRSNHCVRRLDGAGLLTIVCGTASAGFNGDGKPGVNTNVNFPFHGAVDAGGNLFFSDSGNKRIRRFKP
jgi:hypothetical protein